MRWTTALLLSGLIAAAAVGCRSDKVPITPAQQGAIGAGAAGAGVGAVWANNVGVLNAWEGAGVGLAAGAATGALVGDALDEVQTQDEMNRLRKEQADALGQSAGKDKTIADLQAELDRIKSQVKEPNVQIEVKDGQMRFTVLSEVLFDSGKAELKNDGIATLDSIITVIQKEYPDREIAIEGHTDTDPIKASKWNNNRDLSYARSLAVLSHAQEKGIAPEQLKAVACGEFFPVAPNDSAKNKSLNRRAVIVVMPPKSSIILDKK